MGVDLIGVMTDPATLRPSGGARTFLRILRRGRHGAGWARPRLAMRCSPTTSTPRRARPTPPTSARDDLKVGDVANLTTADLPGTPISPGRRRPARTFPSPATAPASTGRAPARSGRSGSSCRPSALEGRAPRLIVIENVTGLLTSHGGKDFDAICDALVDAGYRFGAVVIDAALFVPQSRASGCLSSRSTPALLFPPSSSPTSRACPSIRRRWSPPALVRSTAPIWWRLPVPPARNTTFADLIEDSPTGVAWHTQGRDRSADRDDGAGPSRQARRRQARRQADGRRPLSAHAS